MKQEPINDDPLFTPDEAEKYVTKKLLRLYFTYRANEATLEQLRTISQLLGLTEVVKSAIS